MKYESVIKEKPLEDHPFITGTNGQCNVRFRHKRQNDKFIKMKRMGIETFIVTETKITKED